MKKSLLFLVFISAISYCFPQRTTYEINYYSPRDYGKGHAAENLACVQDRNGVLYFGNAGGLLQYDGINWTFIPVKNQSVWIKSLAVSEENIIYVGAQSEFGYLKPDQSGKLLYISLSDQLTDNQKSFSDIISLWAWQDKVAFQSEEALFLYSGGRLTTILPETDFHLSFLVEDELYIRERGIGVLKLIGNDLQLVKGSEYLKDYAIFAILESSDPGKFTIITHDDGFWSADKRTFKGSKLGTQDSILFNKSEIYGAIRLNDGKIALITGSNGIIITNESFKIQAVINRDNGLKVNGVRSILEDYQGNIWSGLENGIVQVHYSSPVSVSGPQSGISGNVNAIIRYNRNLFIGTTDGLFVQDNSDKIHSSAFVQVPGFSKEVRNLCLAEGSLIVGTTDELFEIKNNKKNKIAAIEINTLYYSENLKTLFVSTKKDLVLFNYSGNWKKLKDIPEITEVGIRFEEEINDGIVTLWLGTLIQGIIRIQGTTPFNLKIDKYNSSDGLMDNSWVYPYKINNKTVFSQRDGLLSFIDERIYDQVPDSLKKPLGFYKGFFEPFNPDSSMERIRKPIYVLEDSKNRIYVNLDGDLGYLDKTSSYSFVNQPFCLEDIGEVNVFFHEDNETCWIGGNDGLLLFNEENVKNYNIDFNTIITRISCGAEDSILYYGYANNIAGLQNKELSDRKFTLSHSLNTVSFNYAAPFFEGQDEMLFSYLLIGRDTIFSDWRKDNRAVFSNLWEGNYTFKVRAKNVYGHISSENIFNFRILSPWYRKPWAYLLYTLLVSALIYSGIRIYTRHLIALNKKLEHIIKERTQEIHEKNIRLEIQKKDILDSINYAQRIQNAVLPDADVIEAWLGDHFIIYRPKDIVSGDFYWATVNKKYIVFCVGDCTGHGVPGAFMSMLCISLLNEIILKDRVIHSETILNKVRKMVIEALKQKGLIGEQKDGMDIAICVYNKETTELEYSGANSPLYIIRKKDKEHISAWKQIENEDYMLYEIKGDRMPIAIYDNMDSFKRHTVKVLKEDRLYLLSDGIYDQFGGPNGRKYMSNAFKTTLLKTVTFEIKDQKQQIEETIDTWQAYINPKTGYPYEQIDDICMLGIKM